MMVKSKIGMITRGIDCLATDTFPTIAIVMEYIIWLNICSYMQSIPGNNPTFGLCHDLLNSMNSAKAIQGKLNYRIVG